MTTIHAAPPLIAPQAPRDETEILKKACNDFEGIFIQYMLKSMRQTLGGDALCGDSPGRKMFESMHDQELAGQIAQERGLGLGEALYRELQARVDSKKA